MKRFKSMLALLLVLLLIFTFAGCGGGSDDSSDASAPSDESQEAYEDDEDYDDEEEPYDGDIWDTDYDEEEPPDPDDDTEEEEEEEEPYEPSKAPEDLAGDYTGAFVSDTETPLNLEVRWAAEENASGDYDVTLHFYLTCYSLQVSERNGNTLEVKTSSGKTKYSFNTSEIKKETNTLESEYVGKTTITLTKEELSSGAKVKAIWDYRGSYSGTDLPEIVAEGQIKG